ncbi:NUDIX domain-containing protein [Nocardioides dubius]|uniref:NUDIX domain-containing protein n=1 Tax=Nocardioides dubius TaxID=317019 RepID=A0ABN1TWB3_9ACTN
MPIPDFIVDLRRRIGHDPLWLAAVTAVVLRGNEVLLVRRSDNGAWSPVTGIIDPGEHPATTAVREVAEETGVRCTVDQLVWVSVGDPVVHANGDHAQYLDLVFRCHFVDGEARVADDESSDVGWFAVDDLPPLKPDLQERIEVALEHAGPARLH